MTDHASGPDISVVVPVRNAAHWLEECLEGLASQTFPRDRHEVLMVDNASTDRSPEILAAHPGIRILREPKIGSYAARNAGIRAAWGRIIAFTDADCRPLPEWLDQLARAMRDPGVGIVQGGREFPSDSSAMRILAAYESAKSELVFSGNDPSRYFAYTNSMAVRRELFDELGPFREMERGADVVFVQQALAKHSCDLVRHCPEARVRHLEITSTRSWSRKMYLYGRSYEGYGRIVPCRPLSTAERLEVLRRVRRHGASWWALARCLPVLLLCAVSYRLGRLAGARGDGGDW